MFKLGYSTGLAEANSDEGKSTVTNVGEIVDKMAKTASEVPQKMLAASKITEVTNGCFSSAQVVQVSDETGEDAAAAGGSTQQNAQAATNAAAEAATADASQVTEANGGEKSPTTKDKDPKNATCNLSCSGGILSSINPLTGQKLVNMVTPSKLVDFVGSLLPDQYSQIGLTEQQFKHLYCENAPYPECATCPYNTRNFRTIKQDINVLLRMITDAIDQLMFGNYDLATAMFMCPGQLNAMLRGNFGIVGNVAAAAVSGSLIALTAARGALYAYEGIASAAKYTDFRCEVMHHSDKLLKSGSLVGLPGVFATTVGDILTAIGCTSNSLVRLTSRSGSARSSKFGAYANLWGDRASGRQYEEIFYRSSSRPTASIASRLKADATLRQIQDAIKAAKDIEDKARPCPPTSKTKTIKPTSDAIAETTKDYYYEVPSEDGTTKTKVKITVEQGTSLDSIKAQVGTLLEAEDNGVTIPDPTTPSSDTVAAEDKTYVVQNPVTKEYVTVEIAPGDPVISVKAKVAAEFNIKPEDVVIYDRPASTSSSSSSSSSTPGRVYNKTKDKVAIAGVTYYTINSEGRYVPLTLAPGTPIPSNTYIAIDPVAGDEEDATPYTGTGPCATDDGLIVDTPVFLDAGSMDMSIDTKSLITKTGVLAGDMAKIAGIGLSVYEIKMAYILDHERNMSVLPSDVTGERVMTILDTIADND